MDSLQHYVHFATAVLADCLYGIQGILGNPVRALGPAHGALSLYHASSPGAARGTGRGPLPRRYRTCRCLLRSSRVARTAW